MHALWGLFSKSAYGRLLNYHFSGNISFPGEINKFWCWEIPFWDDFLCYFHPGTADVILKNTTKSYEIELIETLLFRNDDLHPLSSISAISAEVVFCCWCNFDALSLLPDPSMLAVEVLKVKPLDTAIPDLYRSWFRPFVKLYIRLQRCIGIIASLDRLLTTIGKHR